MSRCHGQHVSRLHSHLGEGHSTIKGGLILPPNDPSLLFPSLTAMTATSLSVDPLFATSNLKVHNLSGSARSSILSHDSDQFLSYYGSEDAGQTYMPPQKLILPPSASTESLSSSEYSLDSVSDHGQPSMDRASTIEELSERSPRSGARSEEGRDRRHIRFGQDDSVPGDKTRLQQNENELTPENNLRSRRGLEGRVSDLKLGSRSDPSQKTYLTAPSTAPVAGTSLMHNLDCDGPISGAASDHQRELSRDVALPVSTVQGMSQTKSDANQLHDGSPSSGVAVELSLPNETVELAKSLKADIQVGRQIDRRAIAAQPTTASKLALLVGRRSSPGKAVQRASSPPCSPTPTRPSLNSTLATASPYTSPSHVLYPALPLPLTHSPNPPRPPRLQSPIPARRRGDVEAVTQPLQLSIAMTPISSPHATCDDTDVTESSGMTAVDQNVSSSSGEAVPVAQIAPQRSLHSREGAFPPSVLRPSEPQGSASTPNPREVKGNIDITICSASPTTPSASASSEPLGNSAQTCQLEPQPNESWIRISPIPSPEPAPSSEESPRVSEEMSRPYVSQSLDRDSPSPTPKSPKGFKASLVRRFSALPRTPSSRGSSAGPKTPSPSASPLHPLPPIPKIKSYWPPAMQCDDVIAKKTSSERCVGYAQKINSLYIYDCGLSDWLMEINHRGSASQRLGTRIAVGPGLLAITPQPRQISGGSMISEVTFPRRPDASVATDLTIKADVDHLVSTSPPPLPYPSLAPGRASLPTRSTSVLGTSSKRMLASPGNFFASLGRKASVRKDKPAASPGFSSIAKHLNNNLLSTPNPRPIDITNTPSVPGGPRAPPNRRVQRSKTVMISPKTGEQNSLNRRPSLFDLSSSERPSAVDPEFSRQVDKLADLLPHANREILAGYLRRAGQDILAIGQYLEDEKNGTIRRDYDAR